MGTVMPAVAQFPAPRPGWTPPDSPPPAAPASGPPAPRRGHRRPPSPRPDTSRRGRSSAGPHGSCGPEHPGRSPPRCAVRIVSSIVDSPRLYVNLRGPPPLFLLNYPLLYHKMRNAVKPYRQNCFAVHGDLPAGEAFRPPAAARGWSRSSRVRRSGLVQRQPDAGVSLPASSSFSSSSHPSRRAHHDPGQCRAMGLTAPGCSAFPASRHRSAVFQRPAILRRRAPPVTPAMVSAAASTSTVLSPARHIVAP